MACSESHPSLRRSIISSINTRKVVRPYPCSLCNNRGTNLALLKTHLKTHKKYSCADCGYSSTEAHINAENHKGAPALNAMNIRNRVVTAHFSFNAFQSEN